MKKQFVRLTESELHQIIEESVKAVIAEEMDEGLFDRLGAAWKGAKQAYGGQKMLDRGTDNFQQQHSMGDLRSGNYENTAAEQAREAYLKYKEYHAQANKHLSLYNKLVKQYNLQKQSAGVVSSPEAPMNLGKPSYNNQIIRKKRTKPNVNNINLRGGNF
jgi:hypothetical protein